MWIHMITDETLKQLKTIYWSQKEKKQYEKNNLFFYD